MNNEWFNVKMQVFWKSELLFFIVLQNLDGLLTKSKKFIVHFLDNLILLCCMKYLYCQISQCCCLTNWLYVFLHFDMFLIFLYIHIHTFSIQTDKTQTKIMIHRYNLKKKLFKLINAVDIYQDIFMVNKSKCWI